MRGEPTPDSRPKARCVQLLFFQSVKPPSIIPSALSNLTQTFPSLSKRDNRVASQVLQVFPKPYHGFSRGVCINGRFLEAHMLMLGIVVLVVLYIPQGFMNLLSQMGRALRTDG